MRRVQFLKRFFETSRQMNEIRWIRLKKFRLFLLITICDMKLQHDDWLHLVTKTATGQLDIQSPLQVVIVRKAGRHFHLEAPHLRSMSNVMAEKFCLQVVCKAKRLHGILKVDFIQLKETI
jgi:hypothetical protein